jgi:hypothetical protein
MSGQEAQTVDLSITLKIEVNRFKQPLFTGLFLISYSSLPLFDRDHRHPA